KRTLLDSSFRDSAVRAEDPAALYRLNRLAGTEMTSTVLEEVMDATLADGDRFRIRDVAEICQEEGRLDEFRARALLHLPNSSVEEIIADLSDSIRRRRMRRPGMSIR